MTAPQRPPPGQRRAVEGAAVAALEHGLSIERLTERDAAAALGVIDRAINRLQGLRLRPLRQRRVRRLVLPLGLSGSILAKAVQQITAPRKAAIRAAHDDGRTWTRTEDHAADWPHEYGLTLVALLEHLPTDHVHAKVAATGVVTMGPDQLRGELIIAGTDVGHVI